MNNLFPWEQATDPQLPNTSAVPSNDLFPWERNEDQDQVEVLRGAVIKNPDEIAKARRLSQQTGISQPEVETNVQSVEADIKTNKIVEQTAQLPITRKTVGNPEYAPIVHDSVEQLGILETLAQSFRRGNANRQLGLAGNTYLRNPSPETRQAVDDAKARLATLGHTETDGFFSYVDSASEVLGQMASSFTDPQLASRLAAGGVIGGTVGALGGPLAPATATAGAAAGMAAGAITHFVQDSFEVESGFAYVDMIDEGIESDVARPLALGVGVINAALETASEAVLIAPGVAGVKALVKGYVNKAIRTPQVLQAARQFATAYVGGITAETATEGTQEFVQILASEWGKQMSDMDIEAITEEEMIERVAGSMEMAFKAMTILAAPGPAFRWAAQNRAADRAHSDFEITEELASEVQNVPAFERAPDIVSEHISEAMKDAGMEKAYISGPEFIQWLNTFEDQKSVTDALGISDQMQDINDLGIHAEIPVSAFNKIILTSPEYNSLREHIKFDEDGMTEFEAKEWEGTKLQDVVTEEALIEDDPELRDVSAELGLYSMFKDAKDLGITPKQFEAHLRAVENAQNETKRRKQSAELKQEFVKIDAEYQKQYQKIEAEALESIGTLPVYQAVNNLQHDRLDGNLTLAILKDNDLLKALPKQLDKYNLTSALGQNGIDPDVYAEVHGYDSAEDMFLDILTSPTYNEAVQLEVERRVKTEIPNLVQERDRLLQARQALLNEPILEMLTQELNAMRNVVNDPKDLTKSGKPKNVSAKLIKQEAQRRIRGMKVQDINPNKFLLTARKYSKLAGVSFKDRTVGSKKKGTQQKVEGNTRSAAENKYLQVINYAMAIEASRIQSRMQRQKAYLIRVNNPKRNSSVPVEYREAIDEILESVRFKGPLKYKGKEAFKNLVALRNDPQDPIDIPESYTDKNGKVNYNLLTYDEFLEMYNLVREIHKKGLEKNRFRKTEEKKQVQYIVELLSVQTSETLKNIAKSPDDLRGKWASFKNKTHEAAMLLFNMDTMVRELDGFEDLGLAYQYLKKPYDMAMNGGYRDGQKGFLPRQAQIAKDINRLFSVYTEKEKKQFNDLIQIPGMGRKISHQTVVAVLLNMGNVDNKSVLTKKTFTEEEVGAITEYASKKDYDFAQSVWDYFDTYWDEIVDTSIRRNNVRPKRVQATELSTRHGTYRGGYYPIVYDNDQSIINNSQNIDQLVQQLRYGRFLSAQTAHGHTISRVSGGANKPISLDLFVINKHLEQVAYDLEVGDAVTDIFKVMNHKDFRETMRDMGQSHRLDAMNLWLRDAVTAETGINSMWEAGARWLRTGLTISSLGWNVGVSFLQPLGLLQTAAVIGKRNTFMGMMSVIKNPSIFSDINKISPFMETRAEVWNKEIIDAQKQLSRTIVDKYTPGKSAQYMKDSFFFGIKKMQRFVDVVTWVGAQRKGLELFKGDVDKAKEYADRMVVRSQASGIFGDRSAAERGSVHKNIPQSELVRVWTPFMSYFNAKLNVAYERSKKTKWNNPASVANLVADMSMLFVWEALLSVLVKGQWPEDDDDKSVTGMALLGSINTFLAGIPGIREVSSAAQGFGGGGVIGSWASSVGNMSEQFSQGEVDSALVKSINRVGGMMLHYPSGQINRTISGFNDIKEDDSALDALVKLAMGPKFK